MADGNDSDSSVFSLSITHIVCYSEQSEWILNMSATFVEEECDFDWSFGGIILRRTLREGILKIFSGSLVVLKGIRHNNLYYMKGSVITENLRASECLDGDSTRLWHSRLGHVILDSLQTLATQGLLEGALTCNMESCVNCVMGKETCEIWHRYLLHRVSS